MKLQIRDNKAWILRERGTSSYTIYDNLESVEKELFKDVMKDVKKIELLKLTLIHNEVRLEQKDEFWMKIYLINRKRIDKIKGEGKIAS